MLPHCIKHALQQKNFPTGGGALTSEREYEILLTMMDLTTGSKHFYMESWVNFALAPQQLQSLPYVGDRWAEEAKKFTMDSKAGIVLQAYRNDQMLHGVEYPDFLQIFSAFNSTERSDFKRS